MSAKPTQNKALLPVLILIALLLVAALWLKRCRNAQTEPTVTEYHQKQRNYRRSNTSNTSYTQERGGLVRNPSIINYSKHARCRMQCRHISEAEVRDILSNGKINYRKSELQAQPCNKRYAVEGTTRDNQRVRIIFAPCNTEETVVTVIDLDREWTCNCD